MIKKENCNIIVLIRGPDDESAKRHLARAWWEWPELLELLDEASKNTVPKLPEPCKTDYKSNKPFKTENKPHNLKYKRDGRDKKDKKIKNSTPEGDISKEMLGLEKELYKDLVVKITHIIHTAADLQLNAL